jgi:hypothetical protein
MHNNVINLNHIDSSVDDEEPGQQQQLHYDHNHRESEQNVNTNGTINNENEDDEEYDETVSFYEEKYVPMYMSNRNLVTSAIEYFIEDDNAIYGRVQL